jgi:hypothetical protein
MDRSHNLFDILRAECGRHQNVDSSANTPGFCSASPKADFRSILSALLLLCVLSVSAMAQTTIARPAYTASLDANGMLTSLRMANTEMIGKSLEFCIGIQWAVEHVEKPNENEIHFFLKSDKGYGDLDYRFEAKRVVVSMRQKMGGFQSWQIGFGEDTLAVENLQDMRVDSAETLRYVEHGDIRPTPVSSLPRTQRLRLHLRNGAKILFWHDGWGAPFNIDETGGIGGMTYHRNLFDNDKPMRLYFALEAPPAQPLQPAPGFTPLGDAFANLYYTGNPVPFTLRFPDTMAARLKAATRWRVSWTLNDFFGRPAGHGSAEFDAATAQSAKSAAVHLPSMKPGWYGVLFALTPVGPVTPRVAPSEFRTRFAVVDRSAAIPDPPTKRDEALSVYGYAALMGLKGIRESHTMGDYFPERGKTDWKRLDEVMDTADREAKRWGVEWFFQANSKPAWCSPADYEQLAFDMVSHCKDRCHVWEVENEPNFRFSPEDYATKAFIPFAKGAKRADPTCTVLGPACVSVPNSIRFVEALKKADALPLMGGLSTHTYMGPGEPWELFGNPQYLEKLHALAPSLPLWQTEQGYTWNHTSRDEQARYAVRQYLNGYAVGVANAHHYYFYTVHNGFEPWYLVESPGGTTNPDAGTLEPAGVALRVLTAQTAGRKAETRDEPLPGVYALRFSGPKDDVIALWTLDFPITLTLRNRILQATRIDGAPLMLPLQSGETAVPVDGYALYLRVPKGEPFALAAPRSFGKNYATAAMGATIHASSETAAHPAAHAIDGRWSLRDAAPGMLDRTYWEAAVQGASPEAPQWLQVDFAQTRTLDRSLLLTPLPAVDGGVPRDYAVQVSDDGTHWRTVVQAKDWVGWSGYLTFPPVHTQHVRLLITRLNDGWHLEGTWRFMVNEEFTRYTSMQCRVLDWMVFGP